MDPELIPATVTDSLNCTNCGAILHFVPGTHDLKCQYCGVSNTIKEEAKRIESVNYDSFVSQLHNKPAATSLQVVSCKGCGSQTAFKEHVTADKCPFCASPLVLELTGNQQLTEPHYVLPFVVNEQAAATYFQNWLKGLWFAPNDLAKQVSGSSSSPLQGVYMPYFTYDTNTVTDYTGQRGDYYYVTETYTVTVNGKQETRTRQVRHTRWHHAEGTVQCRFTDVTVPSSRSLPSKTMLSLGPWNFEQLEKFDERYLSGFRSEAFQVSPEDSLTVAKELMSPEIEQTIREDIGGDEQRIDETSTQYNDLAIKYVMLPVWVSSYHYNKKVYQFTINACTGEVIGERPLSWIKIMLLIVAVLITIGIGWITLNK